MDPWMDWRIRWVCGIKVWVKYETLGQCENLKPWPSKVPENMTWLTCLRFLHLSVFHSSDMFTERHVWSHPFWGFIGSKLGYFVLPRMTDDLSCPPCPPLLRPLSLHSIQHGRAWYLADLRLIPHMDGSVDSQQIQSHQMLKHNCTLADAKVGCCQICKITPKW